MLHEVVALLAYEDPMVGGCPPRVLDIRKQSLPCILFPSSPEAVWHCCNSNGLVHIGPFKVCWQAAPYVRQLHQCPCQHHRVVGQSARC